MSTEEPVTTVGDTDTNQPSTENQTAIDDSHTETTAPRVDAPGEVPAAIAPREDEDEPRPSDFGRLLDQFEQEQSSLQEGEVERGVVIDFGYKSEGIVNQNEFMEDGRITVKRGDEVDVLVKNMETGEGYPP